MDTVDAQERAWLSEQANGDAPLAAAFPPRGTVSLEQALDLLDDAITSNTQRHICVVRQPGATNAIAGAVGWPAVSLDCVRAVWRGAALLLPPASAASWASRTAASLGGTRLDGRSLLIACCERSLAAGYRHCLVGRPAESERLVRRLQEKFGGLTIGRVRLGGGSWARCAADDVAARVNALLPDIVWVGFDTPAQEEWIARYGAQLAAPAIIGLGRSFDLEPRDGGFARRLSLAGRWARHLARMHRRGRQPAAGSSPAKAEP